MGTKGISSIQFSRDLLGERCRYLYLVQNAPMTSSLSNRKERAKSW